MKLYYAPNSRAVRVAWVLEELGLTYEVKKFELGAREMREASYLSKHPMGRVPTLEDGSITLLRAVRSFNIFLRNMGTDVLFQIRNLQILRHT